jgi:Ca2+-binding EF-hand superfamily protein
MRMIVLGVVVLSVSAATAIANEPYLPRTQRMLERLDANKDGRIGLDEIKPRMQRRFAMADTNGDKFVTPEEIDAELKKRMEARRLRMFELMDTDKDGKISEVEFNQVAQSMFDNADSDNNGGVDLAEMKAFKRGQWRKTYLAKPAN